MHKNLRSSNKKCSLVFEILEKNYGASLFSENKNISNKSLLESENVSSQIEKRIKLIGNLLPFSEEKIKNRLLNFIKKNRLAMKSEQICCRYIRQFDTAVFSICENCEHKHNDQKWTKCSNCGYQNLYSGELHKA